VTPWYLENEFRRKTGQTADRRLGAGRSPETLPRTQGFKLSVSGCKAANSIPQASTSRFRSSSHDVGLTIYCTALIRGWQWMTAVLKVRSQMSQHFCPMTPAFTVSMYLKTLCHVSDAGQATRTQRKNMSYGVKNLIPTMPGLSTSDHCNG
jgi:hypothetical protein